MSVSIQSATLVSPTLVNVSITYSCTGASQIQTLAAEVAKPPAKIPGTIADSTGSVATNCNGQTQTVVVPTTSRFGTFARGDSVGVIANLLNASGGSPAGQVGQFEITQNMTIS